MSPLPLASRRVVVFSSALAAFACQPASSTAPETTGSTAVTVLNGEDDRTELYEVGRDDEREILAQSVAALMWVHRVDYANPTVLRAPLAKDSLGFCPDERFVEQPAAAFCSATLIDDDLVLTAGHCLGDREEDASERCQRLLVVFGYHYLAPGQLAMASADDVYTCRRVAYHDHTYANGSFADIAVLQLDRKAGSNRRPARIAAQPAQIGDVLVAAAHGAGLPLKVDQGGAVVEVPSNGDYFVASTDSFAGGSGAPLFSEDMTLLGHQVRGAPDWETDGECSRARHSEQPMEQHQLVTRSVQALCDTGWPSETLCERAALCGDGLCNGAETSAGCSEDCSAPRCGDAVCESSERSGCKVDCGRYADVPPEWLQDPAQFQPAPPEPVVGSTVSGGCAFGASGAEPPSPGFSWLSLLTALALRRRRTP